MSAAQLRTNSPVNISRVLANAAVFDFRRHATRESFMDASNISQEAEELFDLLETRGIRQNYCRFFIRLLMTPASIRFSAKSFPTWPAVARE